MRINGVSNDRGTSEHQTKGRVAQWAKARKWAPKTLWRVKKAELLVQVGRQLNHTA